MSAQRRLQTRLESLENVPGARRRRTLKSYAPAIPSSGNEEGNSFSLRDCGSRTYARAQTAEGSDFFGAPKSSRSRFFPAGRESEGKSVAGPNASGREWPLLIVKIRLPQSLTLHHCAGSRPDRRAQRRCNGGSPLSSRRRARSRTIAALSSPPKTNRRATQ